MQKVPQGGRSSRSCQGPACALAALAIIAPQLLGGAIPQTELVILALACGASLWTAMALEGTRRRFGVAPLASLGASAAVMWTFIQVLPLPCGWVASWQPFRANVLKQLSEIAKVEVPGCTLSWSPGSTRISLALAASLAALLLSSVAVGRAGNRHLLMLGVALSSATMAVVALAHTVSRATRVFDLYAPQQARPPILLAPLLNPNHLAGHLALGFPLCLALGLRSKRIDARVVWLGLSFIVLTTGLFTLSRGGVAALAAGGAGYLVVHLAQNRNPRARPLPRRLLVLASCSVPILGAAMYFTADLVASEFLVAPTASGKLALFRDLVPLLAQVPVMGVGRGALVDASPSVIPGNIRVQYAENLPFHWMLEWGVPVALLVFSLVIASAVASRPQRSKEWALVIGLLALGAHNLVDFSLELAGVASVAAIAFGALLSREHPHAILPWVPRPELRVMAWGASTVAILATTGAVTLLTIKSRPSLRTQLEAALDEGDESFLPPLNTALKHYPLDPTFPILAATRAARKDDGATPRWLNLAMELAPGWAAPHVQAAYYLERHRALSQAALEIRLSFQRNPADGFGVSTGFLRRHPSAQLALEMLPETSESRQQIAEGLVRDLLTANAPRSETESFLRYVLNRFPNSASAHSHYVDLALQAQDGELALQRVHAMLEKRPGEPRSIAALVRVLAQTGPATVALAEFDRAPARIRADRGVLMEALAAAGASSDSARVAALTEELLARYGATADERAALHWQASMQFEGTGNLAQALSHAQQSYEFGKDPGALERVHGLARRAGIMHVALRAATELCHLGHRGAVYCQPSTPP